MSEVGWFVLWFVPLSIVACVIGAFVGIGIAEVAWRITHRKDRYR